MATTHARQSRYLDQISKDLGVLIAALQEAARGPRQLPALTEDQRERLVKNARAINSHRLALDGIVEEVGAVETKVLASH